MSATSIAARIKLARKMAGLTTQAQLLEQIDDWKPSRLGNYEAGVSTPGPEDVRKIAAATEVSTCWLMFGDGPIRPNFRDLQAIRHQNLSHLYEQRESKRGGVARLAKAVGVSRADLEGFLENPFLPIEDDMARALEGHTKHRQGWMDEQHIEDDPLCQSFPEDMRELMMLYSGVAEDNRRVVLATLRVLCDELN